MECLRWVRQPNKDPKTDTLILTDSNIQPMNITSKGIEFKKSVLNTKALYFGVESKSYESSEREEDDDDVCKVFRNIHEKDEHL